MRPIKFRGKRVDNGEWVYGCYVQLAGRHYIIPNAIDARWIEVHPETVGQFTGLCDKKNKEGFAGDIVRFFKQLYTIEWDVCCARFQLINIDERQGDLNMSNLLVGEIIGNIHENPELLEQA